MNGGGVKHSAAEYGPLSAVPDSLRGEGVLSSGEQKILDMVRRSRRQPKTIRVRKGTSEQHTYPSIGHAYGVYWPSRKEIDLFRTRHTSRKGVLTPRDSAYVLAHELGHWMDFSRKWDPDVEATLMNRLEGQSLGTFGKDYDRDELTADFLGRGVLDMIYGPERKGGTEFPQTYYPSIQTRRQLIENISKLLEARK